MLMRDPVNARSLSPSFMKTFLFIFATMLSLPGHAAAAWPGSESIVAKMKRKVFIKLGERERAFTGSRISIHPSLKRNFRILSRDSEKFAGDETRAPPDRL